MVCRKEKRQGDNKNKETNGEPVSSRRYKDKKDKEQPEKT